MGRNRTVDTDRLTTTTRLYADTLRVLKLLAEGQGVTLMDYIDRLTRRAALEDAQAVKEAIEAFSGGQDGPKKPKR